WRSTQKRKFRFKDCSLLRIGTFDGQRHDGTCSSPTAGGPQLPTPGLGDRNRKVFLPSLPVVFSNT
ncbi:unnamed protein product, partial [Staurois parvus]